MRLERPSASPLREEIFRVTSTSCPTVTVGSENAILTLAAKEVSIPHGTVTASIQVMTAPKSAFFNFIIFILSCSSFLIIISPSAICARSYIPMPGPVRRSWLLLWPPELWEELPALPEADVSGTVPPAPWV